MGTPRVEVEPQMLAWAQRRSRRDRHEIEKKFPKIPLWETRELAPTMNQLEDFARFTYTPFGLLLLDEPPLEELPVRDMRTMGSARPPAPSANLLETIYICEQRQEWYRGYAVRTIGDSLPFVGSMTTGTSVVDAAAEIREFLDFDLTERTRFRSWTEALRGLVASAEDLGVLVMISGIVGNNTHRRLDPQEFRGFALADPVAPLVFVNGADTKAAQIFTLVHELAHIWLGQSGVSRPDLEDDTHDHTLEERWCNAVAAEVLVPLESVPQHVDLVDDLTGALDRLAKHYRVSTLVVLRRLHDKGHLNSREFSVAYDAELERVLGLAERQSSGGDFYRTQPVRIGRRFASAVIVSAYEGVTPMREAMRLLGVRKNKTFNELGETLGVNG